MLGDGFLKRYNLNNSNSKLNNNSRFRLLHSIVQKDYLYYKCDLLSELGCKMRIRERFDNREHYLNGRLIPDNGQITAESVQNVYFNYLRDYWYPNGIKIIPQDLKLNNLALAIWYMDDGYSSKGHYFCTNGFSFEDVKTLQDILLNQFEIESTIQTTVRLQPLLYIKAKSSSILLERIRDFICPSMMYKLQ